LVHVEEHAAAESLLLRCRPGVAHHCTVSLLNT
jgi:hypothetical protein